MTKDEEQQFWTMLSDAMGSNNTGILVGMAVGELFRIANAQEQMVKLAEADLQAQVDEVIKTRSEERAEEIVAEKTKRSFIGKRS